MEVTSKIHPKLPISFTLTVDFAVTQASGLPPVTFTVQHLTFVEIVTGDIRLRTDRVKYDHEIGRQARWDSKHAFPSLDKASKIAFNVFHKSTLKSDKCLGRAEATVDQLLELQRQQPNKDISLLLTDKKGKSSTGRLYLRVQQQTVEALGHVAVEEARKAEQRLSSSLDTQAVDSAGSSTNLVSNQKDIVTSFASLLRKVDGLVKLADEIAKIHPYVNFTWQVLSAGFKMVKAQQLQDQKISALVTTMEDIYTFTASVDKFKNGCPLQAVVTQILTQTIECGFFIQEYARNQFAARALKQPFSGTDELIDQFCAEFKRLRANFDSGVNIATALVLSQTARTVDSISAYKFCSQYLH
ncbi:hypothetical protein M422DRAFT_274858 [Sphaerobolus stellatus SS14]|uniref:C2 domain-containing protein n=1 Tax=Sphaerobolus stellatus (strain SS14) TaxID=990650 RepID=A0A0C9T631_SPHS4|nr:hypothetical protein M422DRAFT_274858 [Sphaerobolus stellatus SS14]